MSLRDLLFVKAGGSGGGGGLLVEIAWDDVATLNKNYEEILTAVLNGINPVFAGVETAMGSDVMTASIYVFESMSFVENEYIITIVKPFNAGNDFYEFKSSTSTGTPTYTG